MNKSSSITNEILTIVVAITTVVCFFILPDKISFIVAFCSGVYILYSFYIEVQNKSSRKRTLDVSSYIIRIVIFYR